MAGIEPGETKRKQLGAWLADVTLDREGLVAKLRQLRDRESLPVFSSAVFELTHLSLPENKAERLLLELLDHRTGLTAALGRDPGLAVAAIDYLTNVKRLMREPAVVEQAYLERTERSAITDVLTGLYNRRFFIQALDRELRRCRRYGLELALLMFDLDSFKELNDRYGHVFGDLVLQRVGQVLRRTVREPDVACRFGGEEFAVILPETDPVGAYSMAERVRERVASSCATESVGGRAVEVRLSGGIAAHPRDGDDAAALIERADRALYRSKCAGRDRVTTFHAERRVDLRFPVQPDVSVTIGGLAGPARVIDLSRGGALLDVPVAYPLGTRLELRVGRAPHAPVEPVTDAADGAGNTTRAVHGCVVRVEPAGRGFRIALCFDERLGSGWVRAHTQSARRPRRPLVPGKHP